MYEKKIEITLVSDANEIIYDCNGCIYPLRFIERGILTLIRSNFKLIILINKWL